MDAVILNWKKCLSEHKRTFNDIWILSLLPIESQLLNLTSYLSKCGYVLLASLILLVIVKKQHLFQSGQYAIFLFEFNCWWLEAYKQILNMLESWWYVNISVPISRHLEVELLGVYRNRHFDVSYFLILFVCQKLHQGLAMSQIVLLCRIKS